METHTDYTLIQADLDHLLKNTPALLKKTERILLQVVENTLLKNLAKLGRRTDDFIQELTRAGLATEKILHIACTLNDWITGCIIHRLESQIATTINLPLPVPYCWINMGSGARHEQLIRTDQDNALIFSHPAPGMETRTELFFEILANQANHALEHFGFQKCKGNVMASNPDWRRSDRNWFKTLNQWIGSSDPSDIRNLTIFLDFRPVYGDEKLAERIHHKVFDLFRSFPQASHYLVRDDKGMKLPRSLDTQPGDVPFNIKTGALVHLVNYVRLLAVNNGIQQPSTIGRLKALHQKNLLTESAHDNYRQAFLCFTRMRLMCLTAHFNDKSSDPNILPLNLLAAQQLEQLDRAVRHTNQLKQFITDKYDLAWMNYFR